MERDADTAAPGDAEPTDRSGAHPPPPAEAIRIGTSGWSYPDWRGIFYPERAPRGFSQLAFAASRFDCLEINTTFYQIPAGRVVESWRRQVENLPGFVFTAKAPRLLTHEDPPPAEALSVCRAFREALRPIAESGRLGCVLLQFPWYFRDTPQHRDLLRALADGLRELEPVVEIRHRSFLDPGPSGALPLLGEIGLSFANIDLPRGPRSISPTCIHTGPVGYVRLHGRNREAWFDPQAGRDQKYDYLYSAAELRELLPWMERIARSARVTYVFANNHFRGQAAANAFQLMRLLGREPVSIPESLVREYPLLAAPDRDEAETKSPGGGEASQGRDPDGRGRP